ncbi:hypothetical protein HK101_010554 [Irineochytrium annulatum]|nr:hypothetical protein HK101_010554 [Irineochytrium annulatum]
MRGKGRYAVGAFDGKETRFVWGKDRGDMQSFGRTKSPELRPLAVINHMLASFPLLNHIGLWDDRKRHLDLFERELLSLQKRGRITTYAVNHIIQDPCLEKYMPRETEKDLVDDLVQRCNSRIIAARERERRRETEIKLLVAQPKIVESPRPKDAEEKYNSNSASSLAGLMRSSSGTALAFEGTTSGTETITTSISKLSLSLPDLSTNGHATAVSAKRDPFPNSAMPLKQRRSSASLFRSIIELTESVFLTGIYLDAPSRARLLAAVPPPARWSVRAEHVTVSQGVAEEELIKPLGGLGATVAVRVVGTAVSKGVLAVKVEHKPSGPEEAPVRLSANATAHITVAVAVGSHSREVNNITEWTPLESAEELILTGVLTENKLIGLKGKMGVTSLAQQPKKEVSLGALVQKHHPTLMGKEIGKAVAVVQAWMEKTFMENLSQNLAHIELFVTNLQIRNGTVVVDQ